MKLKEQLLFLFIIAFPGMYESIHGQTVEPEKYDDNRHEWQATPPLDTVLQLSGNFGELRSNHFHYGFDFKTGGKEGREIFACADGYVSRIKVGAWGYGKVVYITHPNGYTTVYGHLSAFNDAIGTYVKKMQYEKERFDLELFPDSNLLLVCKGEVIARSGNTGFSGGPHLHFEIRDTKTEEIINPFHFGINIADTVKPELVTLAVYPLDNNALVNGRSEPKYIPILKKGTKYFLKFSDTLWASGNIGFGLECYDGENIPQGGRDGVYSIELISNQTIYKYSMDRFAFEQARYVNSHIDYPFMKKTGKPVQKSFISKCNKFPAYSGTMNKGVVLISESRKYFFTYIVKDFYGNTSTLEFSVTGIPAFLSNSPPPKNVNCDSAFIYSYNGLTAVFEPGSFYEDVQFTSSYTSALPGAFSLTHKISNGDNIPTHLPYSLTIKTDVPPELSAKALIVYVNDKNNRTQQGGEYANGFVTTKTYMLGKFAVVIDTVTPKIIPKNIKQAKKMMNEKGIEIQASDNLSGIKSWRATLACASDDSPAKWVLMEYEPKKDLLYYTFDWAANNPEGRMGGWKKYTFVLEVTDSKQNTAKYKVDFIR